MQISVIIPVFNNENTIGHVLSVVTQIKDIAEIIVINDGSTDKTVDEVKKFSGVNIVSHTKNLGKGGAVVTGWEHAKNEIILGVDGDLSKLAPLHLEEIIREYKRNHWDMVIAAREQHGIFDMVSGDRMYKKSIVIPFINIARTVGNGIEQVINFAHRGKKIHVIVSKGIGHIQRYQRKGWIASVPMYVQEGCQFLLTTIMLRFQKNQ